MHDLIMVQRIISTKLISELLQQLARKLAGVLQRFFRGQCNDTAQDPRV